jgi:hypothetical protein
MTELDIAPRAGSPVPLAQVTGASMPGLEVLREWLAAAGQARDLVRPLVDTPFLPASLWPLPAGVAPKDFPNPRLKHPRESVEEWQGRREVAGASGTAAVLTGMTLGLDPLVALSQVFVVKGRPGLYAKIKVALAQRAGHDIWDEELTAERVTVCGRRKGWPQDRIVRITVTIEDAERAQWTRNDTYAKTPADMLWSRAVGRVLDRVAADTLNGIPSIETLDDDPEPLGQITAEVSDLPAPARTTAAAILARTERPTAGDNAPNNIPADDIAAGQAPIRTTTEPAAERGAPPAPEVQRYVMPISRAQGDLIKGAFEKHGYGGRAAAVRDQRMRVLSVLLNRPITDARELTGDEARLVLDHLAPDSGAQAIAKILDPGQPADDAPTDEVDPTMEPGWGGDAQIETGWARDEAAAEQ